MEPTSRVASWRRFSSGELMSDDLDSLLELIERARAIAEREGRSTIDYFLSVAADCALEEKRRESARLSGRGAFQNRPWFYRRWLKV